MKYLDRISLIIFFVISITGILEHFLILNLSPQLNLRVIQSFSLGLGYDLMNGAIFGALVLFVPLSILYRKIICIFLGITFMVFIFTDYNYVLLFGTHLPFSTLEYLSESESFFNSASHAIQGYSFWVLFFCPMVTLISLLYIFGKDNKSIKL